MKTKFPFLQYRKIAIVFSIILLIASIASLTSRGLNFGLDFTGGTLVQVGFSEAADLAKVREKLEEGGFGGAVVQNFGTSSEITIRLPIIEGKKSDEVGNNVFNLVKQLDPQAVSLRNEFVGPVYGEQLRDDGGLALLTALLCIMVYVAMRFEWKFAVGSVIALAHDVLIVVGIFSMLGKEFDQTVLAAILAVIGYSLNDTIVVYDRIRENFLRMRKGTPEEVMNRSLNQTFSRTLITSITTLLVLLALFFLGGELINGFAVALLIGVLIGTYSSIYVASTSALLLGVTKEDLMPPEVEKEGADQEELMP
ncbi:protein translocase subunit SecF [Pleionea sp. CnH1-48]|uniref:protein translocase subunit SecF n=1 Tax=Pleionea sp. CnH1-48 TaxID=2954494 RepID=UPI002096B254|nr:protein translocase subunit SecF [Pleionea sp. CnH1-48]MCO7222862.1 protein translocase subunit SecF [Pleionea sp. CnH1-48]